MSKVIEAINGQFLEALLKIYGVLEVISRIEFGGLLQQISKVI